MAEYYVVRDTNTGLYFRGKGANKWGKYYNQASIYRIKAHAENTVEEESRRGAKPVVVPIQIFENTADVVEVKHGYWEDRYGNKYDNHLYECSVCGKKALYEADVDELGQLKINQVLSNRCPHCLAKMDIKTT